MFISRALLPAALLLALVGCDGANTEEDKEQAARKDPVVQALNKAGQAYANHIDEKAKGPAGWDEFVEYATSRDLDVEAVELIRSKGYTFKWGVSYRDASNGVSTFVLAQPAGTGPKLMLDGSIQVD